MAIVAKAHKDNGWRDMVVSCCYLAIQDLCREEHWQMPTTAYDSMSIIVAGF